LGRGHEGEDNTKLYQRPRQGGRKNLGHQPGHKRPASGAIIRKALQQLEAAGLVKTEKGKGRVITPKGQSMINRISLEMTRAS